MMGLWLYRYRVYRTNQHRTGTNNYRYSNGQRTAVQSILALLVTYAGIYTGKANSERWLV